MELEATTALIAFEGGVHSMQCCRQLSTKACQQCPLHTLTSPAGVAFHADVQGDLSEYSSHWCLAPDVYSLAGGTGEGQTPMQRYPTPHLVCGRLHQMCILLPNMDGGPHMQQAPPAAQCACEPHACPDSLRGVTGATPMDSYTAAFATMAASAMTFVSGTFPPIVLRMYFL
mmetsp:Transcript_24089/g.56032  ORF Transcript_24089/g.56032 Transcript_24089/m.56032 type:complete len:172 (+) Transcript_24089:782-1297(+)